MLAGCGEGPLQSPEKASETGAGWMSWEGEGSETSEVGEGHNVGSFVHQGAWTLFKGWGFIERQQSKKGEQVRYYCSIWTRGGGGFIQDGSGVNRTC